MPQLLFYVDEKSLAAYLGGAALLEPHLAEVPCQPLRLRGGKRRKGEPVVELPSGDEDPRPALLFPDDALTLPRDPTLGTTLYEAELDPKDGGLTVKQGRKRERLEVAERGAERVLAQVLRPVPWEKLPSAGEVLFLVLPGEPFARLVTQHLELGRDRLRYAAVESSEGARVLLEVPEPSWFLLERWLEDYPEQAQVYRCLDGPLGARRVYVEWGYRHPLEDWLVDPVEEGLLLLVDRTGTHRTLARGELEDVAHVLALDPSLFPTVQLRPSDEPERVRVALRLEGRTSPRDPELWLLPRSQRARLEELLTQTPEEELRNLMVACAGSVEGDRGGEPLFVVREILTGRAPRLLPLGERAYAPMPGLPNLFVPCERTIAPPLSSDRYTRAFDLRGGELTILDDDPAQGPGGVAVTKLSERAFRPVETIVDFVFDSAASELEEVLLRTPFELGPFAEEDLLPTGRERAPRTRAEQPARKPEKAAPPEEAERPTRRPWFKKLIGNLVGGEEEPAEQETRADPRRQQIEALQRELVLGTPTPRHWLQLHRLLLLDGQADEGLRAIENALWELQADERRAAQALLEETLGGEGADGAPKDTAGLYRRAFSYRREAAQRGGDPELYRRATERVYRDLREQEDRLRKKTRWLLWRLVLEETEDAIEVERQREAILSDLVLRGIEEREVPPFVRHLLLEHFGQKAATGSGATEALAFLQEAQGFAASLRHPAFQAEALAHVAWALAELGQGEQALKVAREAEKQAQSAQGAPPHHAWRARALARVGAVVERVRGREQGRPLLERALGEIVKLMPHKPNAQQTQEVVDARKAFVSWLAAVADAWSTGHRPDDPLLTQAMSLLASRTPNDQSMIIHEAPEELRRLGLHAQVRGMVRALLNPEQLRHARDCVRDFQHPDDAYRVHVQNVMECLERYQEGESVPTADALLILNLLRSQADLLIDEFTIAPLLVALRGSDAPPWEVIERLADELGRRSKRYEARLVRIAGLQRLAELRDRQRGPDLLAAALDEAWLEEDTTRKHRVITRLVHLVPAFGMRQRGLTLLQAVNQRVQEQTREGVYFRNELLLATAVAASKLGDSRASFELIEVGSSRVDLQACKLEYSIVSPK